MGFRVFATGEVLTAANVNDYLMEQAVISCTSSTRPSSPNEGMTIYETDTDSYRGWDGAAWQFLAGLPPFKLVEKSADTTRTSDVSRTADPHLVMALPANSTWMFWGDILVSSAANAAGDLSVEWQFMASATLTLTMHGLDTTLASGTAGTVEAINQANQATTSPTTAQNFGASTTVTSIHVAGRIVVAGTSGNLTLAWAQQASNANGTTLQNGSYIFAQRVG